MGPAVPVGDEAGAEEGGLAGAAGAVEEEGLREPVVVGVVVQDRFEERAGDDPPWEWRWPGHRCRAAAAAAEPGGGNGNEVSE